MISFYLGVPEPAWLGRAAVPMCVSRRRMRRQKTWPRALAGWMLDSGAFTEIKLHGRWTVSTVDYAAEVERYDVEVGRLNWVAIQDWMCEPEMIARTGLSVREHQERTVQNFLDLEALWRADSESPFMPAVQGWEPADYVRCYELYLSAGVDLAQRTVSVSAPSAGGTTPDRSSTCSPRCTRSWTSRHRCQACTVGRTTCTASASSRVAWRCTARCSGPPTRWPGPGARRTMTRCRGARTSGA